MPVGTVSMPTNSIVGKLSSLPDYFPEDGAHQAKTTNGPRVLTVPRPAFNFSAMSCLQLFIS
jgi:hypothetical protein